ncbi:MULTISPECIES: acyloxyacyl hydrolase [Chelatococcus]|uniref:Acyloxyacyl hydrolase n=1 Tax=Chelatococcus caeni TaxID=1348468 RepID=A0A840C559_9HYPH|nr:MULTISPECIES: acyloxyacyl hydrolase [Chelatococcus]ALA18012.1 hypothetical protein AL346_12090 [Chelatococcus sp. CO-6]MBB4019973.1 hypothetical protein [Chelatococcus caeni]
MILLRSIRAALLLPAVFLWGLPAQAADLLEPPAPAIYQAPDTSHSLSSFVSQLRLGVLAHDPGGKEDGSVDIMGEIVFAKPWSNPDPLIDMLLPAFNAGVSVNTGGKTSYVFAGLNWHADITDALFIELDFGGAVHNGKVGDVVPDGRDALGCRFLFREAASIGYRFDANWSVLATVEHLSNGGLCDDNRGLTNVGAKLSYHF